MSFDPGWCDGRRVPVTRDAGAIRPDLAAAAGDLITRVRRGVG